MESYKSYQNQLHGFKDVSESVKTVEKIAASSIHFLKDNVTELNKYTDNIEHTLSRLSLFYKKKEHFLLQKRDVGEKVLIVVTGNKGLVGGLWHNVVNKFLEKNKSYNSIITIGTKGEFYLKEENFSILKSFDYFFKSSQDEEIKEIINYIFEKFKNKSFSKVDILYPQFISLAEQSPEIISFLPFQFELSDKKESEGFPIFESSKKDIFNNLLDKYIGIFFYKIIIESRLSELSARTIAMEHATIKTEGIIKDIKLTYTKQRRKIVTQRQIESFVAHKIIK